MSDKNNAKQTAPHVRTNTHVGTMQCVFFQKIEVVRVRAVFVYIVLPFEVGNEYCSVVHSLWRKKRSNKLSSYCLINFGIFTPPLLHVRCLSHRQIHESKQLPAINFSYHFTARASRIHVAALKECRQHTHTPCAVVISTFVPFLTQLQRWCCSTVARSTQLGTELGDRTTRRTNLHRTCAVNEDTYMVNLVLSMCQSLLQHGTRVT